MPLNIRKYLAELMGVNAISDEDIRKELDELKIDNKIDELTRQGHINPNPEAQQLARKAITGQATGEELEQFLRLPKPLPAQTTEYKPPTGPESEDPTEAAIQAEMAKSKTPYHEAAKVVSAGTSINTGGTQ